LQEYQVLGIRTTIPFFQWLIREPAFIAGHFDTTFVDQVLMHREGPFAPLAEDAQEVAAIAAALHTLLRGSATRAASPAADASVPSARSAWRLVARREALRP
jgi:acetyl-CoA carboxylase biotin carboxylase subunit